MTNLPYKIHEALTERRRQISDIDSVSEPEANHSNSPTREIYPDKEYPRMSKIKLPDPIDPGVTLAEALSRRQSSRQIVAAPLALETLSYVLHSLGLNDHNSRNYPSGGGLYPIETYLLARRIEGLEVGAYHYHTPTHSLEHLWEIPEHLEMFRGVNAWAEGARAVLIFTGSWYKNIYKYREFSYLLGLIETGHIGQNILLAAATLNTPACPLAGFNDDVVIKLLDLNQSIEQPVYCIAFG